MSAWRGRGMDSATKPPVLFVYGIHFRETH